MRLDRVAPRMFVAPEPPRRIRATKLTCPNSFRIASRASRNLRQPEPGARGGRCGRCGGSVEVATAVRSAARMAAKRGDWATTLGDDGAAAGDGAGAAGDQADGDADDEPFDDHLRGSPRAGRGSRRGGWSTWAAYSSQDAGQRGELAGDLADGRRELVGRRRSPAGSRGSAVPGASRSRRGSWSVEPVEAVGGRAPDVGGVAEPVGVGVRPDEALDVVEDPVHLVGEAGGRVAAERRRRGRGEDGQRSRSRGAQVPS